MGKWLALCPDSGELTQAHKDAAVARAVCFKTRGKLYTVAQSADSSSENAEAHMLAQCELAKCKQRGFYPDQS